MYMNMYVYDDYSLFWLYLIDNVCNIIVCTFEEGNEIIHLQKMIYLQWTRC